jgi:hypothetical protein
MTTTSPDILARMAKVNCGDYPVPFRFEKYACATDGHVLICVPSDEPVSDLTKSRIKMDSILRPVETPSFTLSDYPVADLLKWVAVPRCNICRDKRIMKCSQCHGNKRVDCRCTCGECSHEKECPNCEGSGSEECACMFNARTGKIHCMTFNRTLIWNFMNVIQSDVATVRIDIFSDRKFGRFTFGDIVVVLMARLTEGDIPVLKGTAYNPKTGANVK